MRTTVTLDPDVVQLLQATMKERRISFKEALNAAVRNGLLAAKGKPYRFRVDAVDMGVPAVDLTKALALADHMEDEEILRKLSMRK